MLLFRSSEKGGAPPPPRRTAKRADARRVARDLIGLPEVSVGSTRARAPERDSAFARRAQSGKRRRCNLSNATRERKQFLRRARIGSRGSRRARSSQSATGGVIRSSRSTRGPICPRRTSLDSVSLGRRPANARITGVRFFSHAGDAATHRIARHTRRFVPAWRKQSPRARAAGYRRSTPDPGCISS